MTMGNIHNADKFINNVTQKLGKKSKSTEVVRPKWKKQPQYEVYKNANQTDLVAQLIAQCKRIHTKVKTIKLQQLNETLWEVMQYFEAQSIVTWDDVRNDEYQIKPFYQQFHEDGKKVHFWDSSLRDKNLEYAERADVGLTFADLALAESGTVVLFSDKGKGRAVSLLPKYYVALIPKSKIVARMTEATTYIHEKVVKKDAFPSCINFISGPSNSADIEMNLVVGVHGPMKAYYLIIEDK